MKFHPDVHCEAMLRSYESVIHIDKSPCVTLLTRPFVVPSSSRLHLFYDLRWRGS